jgi:endonuclease-3
VPQLRAGKAAANRAGAPSAAGRRNAAWIDRALEIHYGRIRRRHRRDPLDTLIATIISQHTSDTNTDRAFARLRARFPTWASVRTAPTRAVVDAIRPAGLSVLKAPRIQAVLRRLAAERGSLSLAFLRRWPAARAKAWLLSLKGVGPKTAAIVLVFGLGKPAFAVDTHVYRIGKRVGLIPAGLSAEQAHDWMDAMVQ